MSHLSITLPVEAPPDVVFDLVADPARASAWQSLLAEMGEVSGRPGGVGSSYVAYYRVAGRRLEARFVVTAAERPLVHQASGTTRGGWARWTTLIDPTPTGSEVRVDLEYELPGELLGGLVGVLAGRRLDKEFRRTYERLRAVAESDAARHLGAGATAEADRGPRLRVAASVDAISSD